MFKPLYILGAILAVGLIFVYANFNPGMYKFFPKCPFHSIFGIDCPGCGSQRAIYALLHGNIYQAVNYNLLLVLSLPLLFAHFATRLLTLLTGKVYRLNFLYYPATPKVIGILIVVFWIVRNIPVYPFSFLSA